MPIDEQTRQMMELIDAAFPKVEEVGAVAARAHIDAYPPNPDPEPVGKVEDRTIEGPGGDLPVRIYWPETNQAAGGDALPGIALFHGGGWVICGLETHDGMARAMANAVGAVVVSVDYRLAPEHPCPAAADDCYAATRWMADHAADLGIDPARLAVAGDSAGGNLSAVVAQLCRDRGGPALRFQLMVYPVTDLAGDYPSQRDNAEGYFLTKRAMDWFHEQYVPDVERRADAVCSPIHAADLTGLPPAMVVTAEYDPLRDEGEAYGEALRAAGVDVEVRRYDGMFHGFFSLGPALPAAKQAIDDAHAALRAALA